MSMYDLAQTIKLWELEEITTEQAIGQILLQLRVVVERIVVLERSERKEVERGSGKAKS